MKPTERNAVFALLFTIAGTAGLYWLVNVHWSFEAAWWFFALFFVASAGGLYSKLNEDASNELLANKLHKEANE